MTMELLALALLLVGSFSPLEKKVEIEHRDESLAGTDASALHQDNAPPLRPTVAIFSLIRGGSSMSDYQKFVNSRRCLKDALPSSFTYDNIAFHEGNIPVDMKSMLLKEIENLRLIDVHSFGGFRNRHLPMLRDESVWPIGYRHMCHFMSMIWFTSLHKYEYAARVDEDVCFVRFPVDALQSALAADYAYGLEVDEQHMETLETFQPWLRTHMTASTLVPSIPPLPTEKIFFSNFFVTRLSWWEQPKVRRFLQAVNASGGIYLHRWGDAPIQTAALRLYASPGSVVHLDVDYVHISTQNQAVGGEEVSFGSSSMGNKHFRELMANVSDNATNSTPPSPPPSPVEHSCNEGCCDTPEAFLSISVCTGGPDCSKGVLVTTSLLGSSDIACKLTMTELDSNASAFGCPFRFSPGVPAGTRLFQLCPHSCLAVGFDVPGCSSSPPAIGPPLPPAAPPLPPLVPAPTGLRTIATTYQLRLALEDAQHGDTLLLFVQPGSFLKLGGSSLVIRSIELHLVSADEGATIDAEHQSRVFEIYEAQVHLKFITLVNSFSSGNGGMFTASGNSRILLNNVVIFNSHCEGTGSVMFLSGGCVVKGHDVSIHNTSSETSGGALAVSGGSSLELTNSSVSNTTCVYRGGAFWVNAGDIKLRRVFLSHTQGEYGGATYIESGNFSMTDCVFQGPYSTKEGGTVFLSGGSAIVSESTITDSRAGWNGGVIYVRAGNVTVANRTLVLRAFAEQRGGVLNLGAGRATFINGSSFVSCVSIYGGVLFVSDGVVHIANRVSLVNSESSYGGAVYTDGGTVTITGQSSVVGSYCSWLGGAFYINSGGLIISDGSLISNSSVNVRGGTFYINSGTATVRDSTVSRSDAQFGGCFSIDGGELHLVNSVVEKCVSHRLAGAIVHVPSSTAGAGPLVEATSTEFRQEECEGNVFNQEGPAQVLLRDVTFTPLPGCSIEALELPSAFAGVNPIGCDGTYVDRQQRSWNVCSLKTKGACSTRRISHTLLESVICRCPLPEFTPNTAVADASIAPYLAAEGCIVRPNAVFRLGVLLPMFRPAFDNFSAILWSPRLGVYQALREINNKSDGVADDILPNTQLWFALMDSKCDSAQGLEGALHLTQYSFEGQGVRAIIGAGCSEASITAAQVAAGSNVPIISPTSFSPVLSDGIRYPYFLRVFPSLALRMSGMVLVLQDLLLISRIALISSGDDYGNLGKNAFYAAAASSGVRITTAVEYRIDATDFSDQLRLIAQSRSRVLVLISEAPHGANFLLSAFLNGVGGEGYLWMYSNPELADETNWQQGRAHRLRTLKGSFSLQLVDGSGQPHHSSFLARQSQLISSEAACSLEMDDDENAYLWVQDHDSTTSTPHACPGPMDRRYDAFGYDAVFALAHALHNLIEVQHRQEVVDSELLDALLYKVDFQGITGRVHFHDSSSRPDKLHHGDRAGATFELMNFVEEGAALLSVGVWNPCESCDWSEQWQSLGRELVFSTSDNSMPPQQGPCSYGQVYDNNLDCTCDFGFQPDTNNPTLCVPCPLRTSNAGGRSPCDVCEKGYYLPNDLDASTDNCEVCPNGAECPWNTTLATLRLLPGYWRLSGFTSRIYKCSLAEDLATSGCSASGTHGDSACAPGYAGPLCQVCVDEDRYFQDGECQVCPTGGSQFAIAAVVCCMVILVIAILVFLLNQKSPRYARCSIPLRRLVHRAKDFEMHVGFVSKAKLGITFAQVIAALDTTYAIGMPPMWFQWTAILRVVGEINWAGWVVPSECLVTSGLRMLLLRALIPLAVVVVTPIVGAVKGIAFYSRHRLSHVEDVKGCPYSPISCRRSVSSCVSSDPVTTICECDERPEGQGDAVGLGNVRVSFSQSRESNGSVGARDSVVSVRPFASTRSSSSEKRNNDKKPKSFRQAAANGALEYLPYSLVIAFCFTPSVSARIFGAWYCVAYEYDASTDYTYLGSDLSVRCDGDGADSYNEIISVAWILVGIWPIGMVVMYAALLFPCRKALQEGNTDSALVRATSFLHRDYLPGFFWWEILSLMQRTTLTGWLLLINFELRFIRLLAALVVSISFLIILLALKPYKRNFDYTMAAGCQILFVCIFIGGIIVRLYEDISTDSNGSKELAYRFLGLHSSEEIIIGMILIAFAMLALLAFTVASETYAHILNSRLTKKWSVCTMDPPYIEWRPTGIYACFLSHYKMEASSDARYMHDMLRKMLKAPVFLDSSALNDLRNLITEGVHKSDTLVLLVTKGVFSRPWCLLELLEVAREGIPVVMIQMANSQLPFDEARKFILNLESEMKRMNPAGLEFLHQRLGTDLEELKSAVQLALDENEQYEPIVFGSHAGDNAMVATMKDVVERMARATGRNIKWKGENHHPKLKEPKRRASIKQRVTRTRKMSGTLSQLRGMKNIYSSFSWNSSTIQPDVINTGSVIFICCSRVDAVSHARVLRSELQVKLGRACAIGGGAETSKFINESHLVVVLLTKRLLEDPISLYEAWKALDLGIPIVTVAVTGGGYDYERAQTVYTDLEGALAKVSPTAVQDMSERLPAHVTVPVVGEQLYGTLTAIIALAWAPAASKNQLDAIVDDIISRVPKKKFTRKPALEDASATGKSGKFRLNNVSCSVVRKNNRKSMVITENTTRIITQDSATEVGEETDSARDHDITSHTDLCT